jgi:hypothetical protein
MPVAHLLIVLKVAGATIAASAGGSTLGSPGIRHSLRTDSPVNEASRSPSMKRRPSGVAIT